MFYPFPVQKQSPARASEQERALSVITLRLAVVIPCQQHHFQLLSVFRVAMTCTQSHSPINFQNFEKRYKFLSLIK